MEDVKKINKNSRMGIHHELIWCFVFMAGLIFTNVFRSFIVYRFPHLVEICEEKVSEEDRTRAKLQFQNFDRILCKSSILVWAI